jgi:hypothetical protein
VTRSIGEARDILPIAAARVWLGSKHLCIDSEVIHIEEVVKFVTLFDPDDTLVPFQMIQGDE